MLGSKVIAIALALLVPAVALLRLGWRGDTRVAYAGWAIGAVSLFSLAILEGAWGLAVGFALAIIIALSLVLYAAATSPVRARRGTRKSAIATAPADPTIGRRLFVFTLVVPVSFLSAQWLTFGLIAVMKSGGPLEANSVATAFMLQPLVWALLMAWQMCQAKPSAMVWPPAAVALLGTLLWCLA